MKSNMLKLLVVMAVFMGAFTLKNMSTFVDKVYADGAEGHEHEAAVDTAPTPATVKPKIEIVVCCADKVAEMAPQIAALRETFEVIVRVENQSSEAEADASEDGEDSSVSGINSEDDKKKETSITADYKDDMDESLTADIMVKVFEQLDEYWDGEFLNPELREAVIGDIDSSVKELIKKYTKEHEAYNEIMAELMMNSGQLDQLDDLQKMQLMMDIRDGLVNPDVVEKVFFDLDVQESKLDTSMKALKASHRRLLSQIKRAERLNKTELVEKLKKQAETNDMKYFVLERVQKHFTSATSDIKKKMKKRERQTSTSLFPSTSADAQTCQALAQMGIDPRSLGMSCGTVEIPGTGIHFGLRTTPFGGVTGQVDVNTPDYQWGFSGGTQGNNIPEWLMYPGMGGYPGAGGFQGGHGFYDPRGAAQSPYWDPRTGVMSGYGAYPR